MVVMKVAAVGSTNWWAFSGLWLDVVTYAVKPFSVYTAAISSVVVSTASVITSFKRAILPASSRVVGSSVILLISSTKY